MVLALGVAVFATGALAVPAQAGGWAISSLDSFPADGFRADETYRIGYTILQHGQTPFREARTAVEIRSAATGETWRFAATAEGAVGHYVATVRFPAAGEYTWQIDQHPFEPHSLGRITVAAPASAQTQAAAVVMGADAVVPVLRVVLPIAALVTLAAFTRRLLAVVGRGRHQWASSPRTTGSPE